MESATRRREIHRSLNRGIDDIQRARQLVQDANTFRPPLIRRKLTSSKEASIMLVLTRKVGQQIRISDDVEVKILEVVGKRVRLGISAPCGVPVYREEIYQRQEQDACLNHAFGPESMT